eukprot:jgi/Mesvir1/1695/Mv21155-RA.1
MDKRKKAAGQQRSSRSGKRQSTDSHTAGSKKPAKKPETCHPPIIEPKDSTPKLIACFNYKGGVGKTSIAINIGYALRLMGYRTCYVDCDSQCNLTTFFNTQQKPSVEEEPEASDDGSEDSLDPPALDDFKYDDDDATSNRLGPRRATRPKLSANSLQDNIRSFPEGMCQQGSFDRDGREFPATIRKVLLDVFRGNPGSTTVLDFAAKHDEKGEPEYPNYPDGLFLLPGDKDMHAMLEVKMQQATSNVHQPGQEDAFMVLGGFRKALHDIARAHKVKFMVCDFGPSAGVMNETMVASCDYIVPSFQPDFFSASSVYGLLHTVLPSIIARQRTIKSQEDKYLPKVAPYVGYGFNPAPPRLLPFLMTNYATQSSSVSLYDCSFFDLANRVIQNQNVPRDVQELFEKDGAGQMAVPFLRYVPTAFKSAQTLGYPAVGLSQKIFEDRKRELPWGIRTELEIVRSAFAGLARLISNVSNAA